MQRQALTFFTLVFLAIAASSCNAQRGDSQELPSSTPTGSARTASRTIDQANDDITGSRQNAITRSIQKASPAIVGINVTEVREVQYRSPFGDMFDDPFFDQFFRSRPRSQRFKQELHGLGSGFIVSSDGYIVTNDHVAGRATKIIVTMTGGKRYDAKLIGSDPTTDIALLKIEGEKLPYLELGNSDDVIIGEWAIALGNPFGLFDLNAKPTVTVGVISNAGVNLSPQDTRIYRGMIQTDAAISSGNSGGPLVNALGQVIGVNATIYSTAQSRGGAGSIGIGFAIPINRVRITVDELKKNGSIDRDFWTGMRVQQIDENIARYLKLTSTDGVVVVELAPNSPAMRAGLEVGDVIETINGELIRTEDDANIYLFDSRVGDVLKLRVLRDGKNLDKSLKLTRAGNMTTDALHNEPSTNGVAAQPGDDVSVLRAEHLVKSYKKRRVVRDVTLRVQQGEVVGLLGPNGAGKTTTFYMIVGMVRPNEGRVFLDERRIDNIAMYRRARRGIGYLPQEASVFRKMSVEGNILAVLELIKYPRNQRRQRVDQLLEELSITNIRKQMGYMLSGGERRRTEIARALATNPKFILLDEPFAGIDPLAVEEIMHIIARLRERKIGVLITDHNVHETLSITDRSYILIDGAIFRSGHTEELASDPEVRKRYLGETFKLERYQG